MVLGGALFIGNAVWAALSSEGIYTRPETNIAIRLTHAENAFPFTEIEISRMVALLDTLPLSHLQGIETIQSDQDTYVDGATLHVAGRYYEASGATAEEMTSVALGMHQFNRLSESEQQEYRSFFGPDFPNDLRVRFAYDYQDWIRTEAPMLRAWTNPGLFAPALFMAAVFYSSDTQKTVLYEYAREANGRLEHPLRSISRLIDMHLTADRLEMGPFRYRLRDQAITAYSINGSAEEELTQVVPLPQCLIKKMTPEKSSPAHAMEGLFVKPSRNLKKKPIYSISDRAPEQYPHNVVSP